VVAQESVRRALLGGLILLAVIGVYGNARWFGAQMYLKFAENRGQSYQTRVAALHAAGIARRLQPFSAQAMQAIANNDLFEDKVALALDEYQAALQLAPADAFLWRDYALALIYAEQFGPKLNDAVTQAQTWAVKSKPIHLSLAVAGLRVYDRSDAVLQQLWMHSIRIAYLESRDAILSAAYVADQDLLICNGDVVPSPETNIWCAAARWRHGLCSDMGTGETSCVSQKSTPQ
jgi:hypothetical protein